MQKIISAEDLKRVGIAEEAGDILAGMFFLRIFPR